MQPDEIRLSAGKNLLTCTWGGVRYVLAAEYLRVESPSAEVKGHGPHGALVLAGKQHVQIVGLEPVGAYALKVIFDDGHQTGLYTWDYLYQLATEQPTRWEAYVAALAARGLSRMVAGQALKIKNI
jgi:DUF971 family protein